VLLIACANVANLLLARASRGWKDTAVRLALGATRGRLIRQFLTESVLLAAGGSVVGLGFAHFGVWALARAAVLDPDFRFRLSLFVLESCAGLTLLTIILFGLVPALRATRMTLAESIKEGGLATQTISRSRLSKLLVANQIALSLTLLVLASLFGRTLRNLQNVDLGFQRENIAVFDIDPTSLGYRGQRLRTFYDQLLERARAAPGVRAAALSAMTPMSGFMKSVSVSSWPDKSEPTIKVTFSALSNQVSPGYFTTLGIPLLAGRDFRPEDEPRVIPDDGGALSRTGGGGRWVDTSRVCIMDETLARKQFGTVNPVGRRFCYSGEECTGARGLEVVGVVKDAHYGEITRPDELGTFYEPNWSNGAGPLWLEVRFAGKFASVNAAIRRVLQDLDPNVPLLRVRMMEEYINGGLAHERLVAYLSSFFGILALGLAAFGLYGVLAYAVAQRTREIGIRMAMGAQRSKLIGVVLRESIAPVIVGMIIGLVVAFSWSLYLGSMLYGVDSFDLESVLLSVAVLLAAALLAATIPALRATKVDPMVALRYE
jgi:predicted permease